MTRWIDSADDDLSPMPDFYDEPDEPDEPDNLVAMMNQRGRPVRVHPAEVEAKLALGWEVQVTNPST